MVTVTPGRIAPLAIGDGAFDGAGKLRRRGRRPERRRQREHACGSPCLSVRHGVSPQRCAKAGTSAGSCSRRRCAPAEIVSGKNRERQFEAQTGQAGRGPCAPLRIETAVACDPALCSPGLPVGVRLSESLGNGCRISYIKCGLSTRNYRPVPAYSVRDGLAGSMGAPLRAVEQFVHRAVVGGRPHRSGAGLCVDGRVRRSGPHAFQGMGRTTRTPRPVRTIETDLPPIAVDFRDVAESAGLTGRHVSGDADRKKFILEATGGGVAIFDADGDGLMDVFVANGHHARWWRRRRRIDEPPLSQSRRSPVRGCDRARRAAARRLGSGRVRRATTTTTARPISLVTYYGQSALYRNLGEAGFRDVTGAAGLTARRAGTRAARSLTTTSTAGWISPSTSYLEFDRREVPEPGSSGYCQWKGRPVMCGPRGLPFARNRLFHNKRQTARSPTSRARAASERPAAAMRSP